MKTGTQLVFLSAPKPDDSSTVLIAMWRKRQIAGSGGFARRGHRPWRFASQAKAAGEANTASGAELRTRTLSESYPRGNDLAAWRAAPSPKKICIFNEISRF